MQKASIQNSVPRTAQGANALAPAPGMTTKAKVIADLSEETKQLVARLAATLSYGESAECGGPPNTTGLLSSLDYATVNLQETNKRLYSLVEEIQN